MSGANRAAGERLRAKFARVFGLRVADVEMIEIEPCHCYGERCQVQARIPSGLPAWTTQGPSIGAPCRCGTGGGR